MTEKFFSFAKKYWNDHPELTWPQVIKQAGVHYRAPPSRRIDEPGHEAVMMPSTSCVSHKTRKMCTKYPDECIWYSGSHFGATGTVTKQGCNFRKRKTKATLYKKIEVTKVIQPIQTRKQIIESVNDSPYFSIKPPSFYGGAIKKRRTVKRRKRRSLKK